MNSEMMKSEIINPVQPYIVLQTKDYRKIEMPLKGISHCYEFRTDTFEDEVDAVPDGSVDLLFRIGEKDVRTYISGTVYKAKPWSVGGNATCFGVRFQPGQGILPNGITMSDLVDDDIEIDSGLFGNQLAQRIGEASSMEERAELFKEAYLNLAAGLSGFDSKDHVGQYLVSRIVNTKGCVNVASLAEETNYSECYIRRLFKAQYGISPKQFSQFVRFQHLLEELKYTTSYDVAALDCGYYDESHMIKEFKKYTRVTPEAYCNMMKDKVSLM